MYKYLHDVAARTVYRVPVEPQVTEQNDNHGKRTGWQVRMEYDITCADNQLTGNRWKYATSAYPDQHLDSRYTKEQAVSFFRMRHEPHGDEITESEYEALRQQYEAEAVARKS